MLTLTVTTKRPLAALGAVLALTAGVVTSGAVTSSSDAAPSIFGGHGKNASVSTLSVRFQCHNDEWWTVRPGSSAPCGDTDAFYVPAYGRTYLLTRGPHWTRMSVGKHEIPNLSWASVKRVR